MINLDGLSMGERNRIADALDLIAHHSEGDPDAHAIAAEIPPTYRALAEYARQANVAAEFRASGDIRGARYHENRCELIYNNLPDWARW